MNRIQRKYLSRSIIAIMRDINIEFMGVSKNYVRVLDASAIKNRFIQELIINRYNVTRWVEGETIDRYDVVCVWKVSDINIPWSVLIRKNPQLIIYLIDMEMFDSNRVIQKLEVGKLRNLGKMLRFVDMFDSSYIDHLDNRPLIKYDARKETR